VGALAAQQGDDPVLEFDDSRLPEQLGARTACLWRGAALFSSLSRRCASFPLLHFELAALWGIENTFVSMSSYRSFLGLTTPAFRPAIGIGLVPSPCERTFYSHCAFASCSNRLSVFQPDDLESLQQAEDFPVPQKVHSLAIDAGDRSG